MAMFWFAPPPPSLNYHSLSIFLHCVSTHFYAFYCILVYLLHKSQIFGVISIIVQPPSPISLNYHSRSQPPPPSVSEMIFERFLTHLILYNYSTPFYCHDNDQEQSLYGIKNSVDLGNIVLRKQRAI